MKNILFYLLLASFTPQFVYAQTVLLEDFSTLRLSGQGPPNIHLWHGMSNQGPTNCAISNGNLVCTTAGTAPNGLGFWFNSLNCDTTSCYGNQESYIKGRIKSGSWSADINRMRFRYKCATPIAASSNGRYWLTVGTYVRSLQEPNPSHSGQGSHAYHFFNSPSAADEWVYVEMNRIVNHRIGYPGDQRHPEDPEWYDPSQTLAAHYYDGLTHFYFGPDYSTELQQSGSSCTIGAFTLDTVQAGADSYVANITGTYTPQSGRYSLSWNQPKNTPGGTIYDVRYSASSLRTNGWSSGSSGGTAGPGEDQSPYAIIDYASPQIARQTRMYFAIRPRMRVISASVSGAIRLKVYAEHFLSTGDTVLVANTCANADGLRTVTVVDKETISLDGTSGSCAYLISSRGTVTATAENRNFAEMLVGPASTSTDLTPPSAPTGLRAFHESL